MNQSSSTTNQSYWLLQRWAPEFQFKQRSLKYIPNFSLEKNAALKAVNQHNNWRYFGPGYQHKSPFFKELLIDINRYLWSMSKCYQSSAQRNRQQPSLFDYLKFLCRQVIFDLSKSYTTTRQNWKFQLQSIVQIQCVDLDGSNHWT
jgi:hypothetical protein